MRKNTLSVVALALIFSAAPLVAKPNALPVSGSLSRIQSQSEDREQVQTFTGRIAKSGDKFVLQDDGSQAAYELDDQQRASQYEGKKVKVTGTLDQTKSMIHVRSIEAAA